MNQRILVIGCSGSGKTSLSVRLGQILLLPVIHLDAMYWGPGWTPVPRDVFDNALQRELEKERWLIDGNFDRTLPLRLSHCDTVIYLDFSKLRCIAGAIQRTVAWHGKTRPDMGPACPEQVDWEFLKSIWRFNRNQRKKYYQMLRDQDHAAVWIVRNRKQADALLKHFSSIADGK